uniref:Uncharacterized protein n=1 Tax=Triticum urartu TaxID=4572 RepID=A0A8R7U600_TRIUA
MKRKFLCLQGAEADVIVVTVKRVLFWPTTKEKWWVPT